MQFFHKWLQAYWKFVRLFPERNTLCHVRKCALEDEDDSPPRRPGWHRRQRKSRGQKDMDSDSDVATHAEPELIRAPTRRSCRSRPANTNHRSRRNRPAVAYADSYIESDAGAGFGLGFRFRLRSGRSARFGPGGGLRLMGGGHSA